MTKNMQSQLLILAVATVAALCNTGCVTPRHSLSMRISRCAQDLHLPAGTAFAACDEMFGYQPRIVNGHATYDYCRNPGKQQPKANGGALPVCLNVLKQSQILLSSLRTGPNMGYIPSAPSW